MPENRPVHSFLDWSRGWTWRPRSADVGEVPGVGVFTGERLDHEHERVQTVLHLWREMSLFPPAGWERSMADLLHSRGVVDGRRHDPDLRYVRSDRDSPMRPPEHELELQILKASEAGFESLDACVVDAVNSVPLVRDAAGGRASDVEIDIVFLVEDANGYSLQLLEVKHAANDAWFAVVEALHQLVLFESSTENSVVRQLMCHRNPALGLQPAELKAKSVVLAPEEGFYAAPGKRRLSVAPAERLIERARAEFGAICDLAVWDPTAKTVTRRSSKARES